jgi:excisionase family DNA binding protein
MSGDLQHPSRYTLAGGEVVVVPARVAAWLDRNAGLDRLRIDHRGADAELDAVLCALRLAALVWRSSACGTSVAVAPEPGASWLSTGEVAAALGITARGVRKAIAEGRLQATREDGRWRVAREDVEQWRAARAA